MSQVGFSSVSEFEMGNNYMFTNVNNYFTAVNSL